MSIFLHMIIMFVVIGILVYVAGGLLGNKLRIRAARALAIGAAAGLVHGIAPKVPAWLAMILLVTMLILMAYMVIWWYTEGSTLKEMLAFVVIDGLFTFTGSSAAARILDLTSYGWLIGIVRALPAVFLVLSIGFFIFDRINFKEWLVSEDFTTEGYDDEEEDESEETVTLFEKLRRWVNYEYEEDNHDRNFRGARNSASHC